MGKRGREVLGDHNAFAGRERVILNHVRRPERLERFLGLGWRSGHSRLGGRDAPGGHDLLGEGFGPLNPCRGRVRPEGRDPRTAHASATPATSGASARSRRGPPDMLCHRTTSSGSLAETACSCASAEMPGLPGAACSSLTAGSAASARTIACSLPAATDHKYSHAPGAYPETCRLGRWRAVRAVRRS